ncbi:hypothetical protein E4T47_08633 [Aureobasidium subglaciale]|nr:hypothetical protein E4T47_08633 [Aureobasidium subglaciale]
MFQELAAAHSDAEMEASNVTHKHFIDKLEEAFEILGGREWLARQQAENEKAEDLVEVERVIFSNPFLPLTLDNSAQDISEEEEDSHAQHPSISQRRMKKHRKDKIRQKKQKAKSSSEPIVEDVPLESYRIIDGPDDLITDYYIAVTSIVDECYKLRQFVHKQWFYVSHSGLNSAVAGTVSRLAVSMMRRTVSAIFVDFPSEKDTYQAVMQTFTRGDFNRVYSANPCSDASDKFVDMNEALSIHVYRDLHDFIVDYQKNRSGKPTRSMQVHLSKWNPDLDLLQACKTDRITWRRMFTINWLYDLVNVYVYSLRKFNPADFEGVALESGPWSYRNSHSLFAPILGLEEFAGIVTTLAMQKPSSDVSGRILLWHVLQLQCIVDATTLSKGWSCLYDTSSTPVTQGYCPRQDLDVFLGKTPEIDLGFYWGAQLSLADLERDASSHGDPMRSKTTRSTLSRIFGHICDTLGQSADAFGDNNVPSRFSGHDSNGLWNYSPFMCGTGLMEALEITYRATMTIWDKVREPFEFLHLYNMATQKGHIQEVRTMWTHLISTFATGVFDQGTVPTEKFYQARSFTAQRENAARLSKNAKDLYGIFGLDYNRFFRHRSNLLLYREADYDPERIPEHNMDPNSSLARIRMQQTQRSTAFSTGEVTYQRTELIQRAIAQGMTDETISSFSKLSLAANREHSQHAETFSTFVDQDLGSWSSSTKGFGDASHGGWSPSGLDLLEMLKVDVCQDIAGCRPVTGLNFMWITSGILGLIIEWEKRLKESQNPLFLRNLRGDRWRREGFVKNVLGERPGYEECLEVFGKVITDIGSGYAEYICWQKASIMEGITCCGTLEQPFGPDETHNDQEEGLGEGTEVETKITNHEQGKS